MRSLYYTEDKVWPNFSEIYESYLHDYKEYRGYVTNTLVIHDKNSGSRGRYHVYRLDFWAGTLKLIGNELPLVHARALARRPIHRDGTPILEEEHRIARMPTSKYRARYETK